MLLVAWGVAAGMFNAFQIVIPQYLCPYGYSNVSISCCVGVSVQIIGVANFFIRIVKILIRVLMQKNLLINNNYDYYDNSLGFFVFITASCGPVGIVNDILWAGRCDHSWCDFRLYQEVQRDWSGLSNPSRLLYYLVYRGKLNNFVKTENDLLNQINKCLL